MEFRERIIDVFINSVYLYDDKTVIYYNIEGGKQVSYMEMLDSTEEPPFADDLQGSSGVRISNDTPRHVGAGGMSPAPILCYLINAASSLSSFCTACRLAVKCSVGNR